MSQANVFKDSMDTFRRRH